MSENVLIAGGSGLIGSRLTQLLLERDYCVSWLSRSTENKTSFRVYHWDTVKGVIENGAVEQADHIINLAGANLNTRWTEERKKIIVDSRVNSANLIFKTLKECPNEVKTYISASGISYYGNMGSEWMTEDFPAANDFLGTCCRLWEKAACQMESLDIRTIRIRTGMVLSDKGGALPKLAGPVKAGIGAALGNGQQWVSWIHIDDICKIYIHALENQDMHGAYNAATPNPVSNKGLIKEIARTLNKPLWLPNVPALALRAVFGEMSSVVLDSTRVSAERVLDSSFRFRFPELPAALRQIYL
ncbi:hypothetical protein EDD80_106132 [Anseongella ginsenosidimutans]|uniref:TIGR01777 family protein n=1 Tax=Anseongella ginsenosidimutans TaxID=496056 RepID=A0A4R3KSW1_9SPHI|nr:TIGR01777 family oxidoreductase [Anseongella ginsenosidimutans]QEC52266.1 TIGR01777 family protein [Anseongella ginsenosidimutans]TCS86821.1 hypothetical protein EDD80_106132 [Anseongella ginsenosidimutans]